MTFGFTRTDDTVQLVEHARLVGSLSNVPAAFTQPFFAANRCVEGTVSEPATVTVGGKAATVTAHSRFEGQAAVPGGTGQVAVTATDPSGNLRTNTYEVTQGATSKTFTYDPNGNLTSKTEGPDSWTHSWNAENQLTKVEKNGSEVARFAYDPRGRGVDKAAGRHDDHVHV